MSRSRRHSLLTIGALGASCYTSAPVPPPVPVAEPAAAVTIGPASVGPITAQTPANLIALRAALLGFEVKPAHIALGASTNRLGYNVYKDNEKLLQVYPDANGAIFNIHVVSPKVAIADRPWKIGARFNGVKSISTCKCWAEEVVVCFKAGDHVAVAFARECRYESYEAEDERQDLIGLPIHHVLWSPKPYTPDSHPYGGNEYGGDDYGGS
ncbi:MAG TPA: hypothetical protein VN253_13830 [Kofleriaceae bacterium]|nr:hypothetical protein [Kofleriaceae bacterium]